MDAHRLEKGLSHHVIPDSFLWFCLVTAGRNYCISAAFDPSLKQLAQQRDKVRAQMEVPDRCGAAAFFGSANTYGHLVHGLNSR